jgi:hypothetical protein
MHIGEKLYAFIISEANITHAGLFPKTPLILPSRNVLSFLPLACKIGSFAFSGQKARLLMLVLQ